MDKPFAYYIESNATPGECWELIEGRDPVEYVGDDAFTVRPLYDTTPARAEAQDEGAGEWPEKWSGDCTVGNMIANLRTLPPEMPLYTAYHIPMDGEPSLLRVKRPTMSRERVDGITIKTGDESVPYSAVIWTQPQDPLEAHPSPTPAADADRVRIAVEALEAAETIEPLCMELADCMDEERDALVSELQQAHDMIAEALAALKSTAAKEGGE